MARPAIVTPEPIAMPEHELLARVFRTLGDPTRLRMVEALLDEGELTQSELVARVGAAQRSGRVVRYRVIDPRAAAFVRLARQFLADNEAAVGCCTVLDRG